MSLYNRLQCRSHEAEGWVLDYNAKPENCQFSIVSTFSMDVSAPVVGWASRSLQQLSAGVDNSPKKVWAKKSWLWCLVLGSVLNIQVAYLLEQRAIINSKSWNTLLKECLPELESLMSPPLWQCDSQEPLASRRWASWAGKPWWLKTCPGSRVSWAQSSQCLIACRHRVYM